MRHRQPAVAPASTTGMLVDGVALLESGPRELGGSVVALGAATNLRGQPPTEAV